jgi:hypothetical protein
MIEIINIHAIPLHTHVPYIYIGRGGRGVAASPLANPFKLSRNQPRAVVIAKYDIWLHGHIRNNNPSVINELHRIMRLEDEQGTIQLGCFCKPRACHGDCIVAAIESLR